MKTLATLCAVLACAPALGQTASPMTPPPEFPRATPYDAQRAPASARQQAAMVRIPGGTYTIGSPAQHPLANQAAMPQHRVELKPFRLDRTEGLLGRIERGHGAGRVLEIGGMHRDAAFGPGEAVDQRLAALFQVLQVAGDEAHAGPLAEEPQRAGQADALAAAGDENVLVLELEVHGVSLSCR